MNVTKILMTLEIFTKNNKKAKALVLSTLPDNVKILEGINISSELVNENIAKFNIEIEKGLGSFLHAFNDLIICLIAVDNSINTLQHMRKR